MKTSKVQWTNPNIKSDFFRLVIFGLLAIASCKQSEEHQTQKNLTQIDSNIVASQIEKKLFLDFKNRRDVSQGRFLFKNHESSHLFSKQTTIWLTEEEICNLSKDKSMSYFKIKNFKLSKDTSIFFFALCSSSKYGIDTLITPTVEPGNVNKYGCVGNTEGLFEYKIYFEKTTQDWIVE